MGSNFSLKNMPPVTLNLIIINVLMWFATLIFPQRIGVDLIEILGLHYFSATDFRAYQLLTYLFVHSTTSAAHVFFNMFTLFMFGVMLERALGSMRFLFYYLSCGVGAALVQELAWSLTWENTFIPYLANLNGTDFETIRAAIDERVAMGLPLPFLNSLVTIGASGAVYGVLLAFAMFWPNMPLFIMFIPVPIKAKWMVIGYGVIELLIGMSEAVGVSDGVAHFAHLGGMLFGLLIILYWKHAGLGHE